MENILLEFSDRQKRALMAPSFRDLVCNDLQLCEQAEFAQAAWTAEKTGAGIDRILVQAGHITQVQARDALCRYLDVAGISLADWIPDAALCAQAGYRRCLAFGFIPWQRLGNSVVLAVHDAERMTQIVAEAKLIWPDHRIGLILATPDDVTTAIATAFGPQIAADALTTCPTRYSCRNWGQVLSPTVIVAAITALLIGAIASPTLAITILLVWILIANSATLGLRLTAIFTFRWTGLSRRREMIQPPVWPTISLLLPVFREEAVIGQLIRAMQRLDYPADALDIIILLESDDNVTRNTLRGLELPPYMRVIEVPPGPVRTKPRAMNYALPFCRGSIVGIYDAEDAPQPDQLRKVATYLHSASWKVCCVQARLDFYNPDQNWLTRCFTLEYGTWFRVLLHGVQFLGLPLPLGGTSVFFRRPVLEEIGAWDAHNVTEDAELGVRLARFGYRCEMIDSTTFEEANSNYRNWISQRSRWLKGYYITWASHMRRPRELLRDLGLRGFLGFHVMFLGAITAYLAIPLFWTMTGLAVTGAAPDILSGIPEWLWTALFISLPFGQIVMLGAVMLALRGRGDMKRLPWALTLPAYWPLGALAAWQAVVELFVSPYHWHKTKHGLTAHRPENIESVGTRPAQKRGV